MKKVLAFYLFLWGQWWLISIFSFVLTYKIPLFGFLIIYFAVFAITQLYNKPISFLSSCFSKKNENANNTSNRQKEAEQKEEASLKSSPGIALEVRRLERISIELDNAQSDETLELI